MYGVAPGLQVSAELSDQPCQEWCHLGAHSGLTVKLQGQTSRSKFQGQSLGFCSLSDSPVEISAILDTTIVLHFIHNALPRKITTDMHLIHKPGQTPDSEH